MGVQVPPSAPQGIWAAIKTDCGFLLLVRQAVKNISERALAIEMKMA
jgi:hypothetical protein